MEVDRTLTEDQNIQRRAKALQSLSTGPIPSSISKITASSRGLPSGKDFDFYCNLDEFKCPVDEIAAKCQAMLTKIGSSKQLWDTEVAFPVDVDDAYDLVVNINDEVLERFDMSGDEFSRKMKAEEEGGIGKSIVDQDGFQLVRGKTKKETGSSEMNAQDGNLASTTVRVAERDKQDVGGNPKVPFHIPTIRKPQDQYNIRVNNSNQPFQHVWLQRSEDGSRFIHPLENMSFLDFVDQNIEKVDPMKPPPLASTPFKLVEDVKDLKELAAKLRSASEFSIDLEHNHYRSFQGLTCLMQISTRTEDFVIDTLKLRVQIGPYLREVFKDSTKKKVMHGADWDIMWLQRDFGIYVCNLFDTGQASRVLKLERNSLEYLLHHFCGVTANKEYQKADWRLRPLPHVMIRYAREDTHYLLYIYDLMRIRLMSESTKSEKSDALLVEVYERSYKICSQLYEKELLTDSSYLHVYGVLGANFNARQLGIIAGLCEWRDIVARSEDESTGYILPNKTLLEIAKQMPVTTSMLRRLVKSKHIDRNLGTIVNIIRHAMQNAAAFEPVALQLREAAARAASESNMGGVGECNVLNPSGIPVDESNVSNPSGTSIVDQRLNDTVSGKFESRGEEVRVQIRIGVGGLEYVDENENFGTDTSSSFPKSPGENIVSTKHVCQINASSSILEKAPGASVQVLKKHNQDVGAPPGKLPAKRKVEQNKGNEETKLEQIKSSVSRRFHEFSGTDTETKLVVVEPSKLPAPSAEEGPVGPDACTKLDDNVKYEKSSSNNKKSQVDESGAASEWRQNMEALVVGSASEDYENEPMSLSDLSSSVQIFLKPTEHNQETKRADRSEPSGSLGFKPFDCAAAREQVKFGETARRESKADGCANKETHSILMKRSDRRTGIAGSSGKDDDTLPSSGKGARGFSC